MTREPFSRVFLHDLAIEADIGCYAHEKGAPQPLIVHVTLDLDVIRFENEDLGQTVDYTLISGFARRLGASHIDLVETFAERLAEQCLVLPGVREACVRIEKPKAVPDAMAGIEIRRLRQGAR